MQRKINKTKNSIPQQDAKQEVSGRNADERPVVDERSVVDDDPVVDAGPVVDLGLSVKWASCNLGAKKQWEFGDYFAWGESSPKNIYGKHTYKISAYHDTCSPEFSERYYVLSRRYDVAYRRLGEGWRIPSCSDFEELTNNCDIYYQELMGVNGYMMVSRINGHSIFLPAAELRHDATPNLSYTSGYYSTREMLGGDQKALHEAIEDKEKRKEFENMFPNDVDTEEESSNPGYYFPDFIHTFNFDESGFCIEPFSIRYDGYSIRPIFE